MSRVLLPGAIIALLPLILGCPPNCRYVCEKLVEECELPWEPDYVTKDCRTQCEIQEAHYEDDEVAAVAYQDHLDCLMGTDCEDLEADPQACCDGEIYVHDFCP